jgi:hypothetical protein
LSSSTIIAAAIAAIGSKISRASTRHSQRSMRAVLVRLNHRTNPFKTLPPGRSSVFFLIFRQIAVSTHRPMRPVPLHSGLAIGFAARLGGKVAALANEF